MTRGSDRSAAAIARWLAALLAAEYDLRLVPANGGGPTLCRRLDAGRLMAVLPWVKARNAQGHHVYCRPASARHVLVDDLCPDGLAALAAAHRIAAVVETSKANHQAWVTVSSDEVPTELAGAAARLLARRFGGDPGAASGVQLGRLVGTTNQKERHRRGDGSYPFVLLHSVLGGVDAGGAALLNEAARLLHSSAPNAAVPVRPPGAVAAREAAEAARRIAQSLPAGVRLDRSRLDHAIAHRLLVRGADAPFAAEVVLAGARACSMPAAAAADYAARTVRAAARALEHNAIPI